MRWIALDGAVNIRDVGGMPTLNGSVTAEKRLLRSDNLQQLSAADVARLVGEFGLTRVIDLRSLVEVTAEGPGPLAAIGTVEHVHHSVIPVQAAVATVNQEVVADALLARRERYAALDRDEASSRHYLGYLEDRADSVVAALRAIGSTPGAALVHCAAGKDRTGVIVALALITVGVGREDVIADYAATGARIGAILARLRASGTYAASLRGVTDDQHTPRPGTMVRFLERLDDQHGGVINWLAGQGFGPDDVEKLKVKLLEPAISS